MFAGKYRPLSFKEMKGAERPCKMLKAIARKKDTAPRSLIFNGLWGSGKTTSSRIFAKAVNCQNQVDDACNKCEVCLSINAGSHLYTEYDSAIVGNVDTMKSLRESFNYSMGAGVKVVCFDEVHTISKQAQSVLLKVLEEAPKGIFYVFATTDSELLLPTIRSRSLTLEYEGLSEEEIAELLCEVSQKEGINPVPEVISYISRRVNGHARDALQELEIYALLGENEYLKKALILDLSFNQLVEMLVVGDKVQAEKLIRRILQSPIIHVEQDFEKFIKKIADKVFLSQEGGLKSMRELVFFYLKHHRYLKTTNDWYLFLVSMAGLLEIKKEEKLTDRFQKR